MEKVKINIVPKGLKPACYLSQNDNGRVVRFELFDELTPYTLDGSETITITVVRPDGVELVSSVVNTEDSYIDVVFNDDMTAIAGIADCELTITDGETVIGSRNFDMNIEIDAYNGKDVVIETATGVIASFNTEVEDNALEYESEIPYNAEGYTGLRVINSRTAPVFNKTPYLFRKTPDGSGNSCIEKLNGLSVAFNQLVQNGNFEDSSYWSAYNGSISVTSNVLTLTATENISQVKTLFNSATPNVTSGHKCLTMFSVKPSENTTIRVRYPFVSDYVSIAANVWNNISLIDIADETKYGIQSYYNLNETIEVKNYNCIDLTQMFGSTIADYIYSLEQATAGAGVSLFKSLGFDKPYYEYNAGSLLSSKPVSKKVVGFNQWDEEWIYSGGAVNSKNYIRVLPNTTYYYHNGSNKGLYQMDFYTLDKTLISSTGVSANSTFTTPTNTAFIKFTVYGSYGTTYNHDICINFSDPDKNGTYEPYSEETYNLGGDELRGILKLDANNNIYAYGDIKTSDGNIERKFGIIDLGSLNWQYYGGVMFTIELTDIKQFKASEIANLITPDYEAINNSTGTAPMPDMTCKGQIDETRLYIKDSNYTDPNAFKTAMDGVYLIYELETPTTESADPYTDPQEVKITEEFIDERSIPIPVGHDTIYGTDIEYQDIDFDTTIFGGDINAIDGVLTSRYNSDGSVKTTPDVIELDPALIPVKAGDNNIFNSASGAQTIRYYNQED